MKQFLLLRLLRYNKVQLYFLKDHSQFCKERHCVAEEWPRAMVEKFVFRLFGTQQVQFCP